MDALKHQIGGEHYHKRSIQPIEFVLANRLGFCEGSIVKYVTRWQDKGGVEDLKKARHYLDFLIEDAESSKDPEGKPWTKPERVAKTPRPAPVKLRGGSDFAKEGDRMRPYPGPSPDGKWTEPVPDTEWPTHGGS